MRCDRDHKWREVRGTRKDFVSTKTNQNISHIVYKINDTRAVDSSVQTAYNTKHSTKGQRTVSMFSFKCNTPKL